MQPQRSIGASGAVHLATASCLRGDPAWPAARSAWQVEVGEGYSSPIVANGRVFLHSRRDPKRSSPRSIWRRARCGVNAPPFSKNVRRRVKAQLDALVDGNRLFTLVTGV
jgi:hypothetical protein